MLPRLSIPLCAPILAGVIALCGASPSEAQGAFELAGHRIPRGSSESFLAPVGETHVPLTVINGARPGPVLTLTAGIHGDEFPSIFALQRIRSSVAASQLSGTLILVHLANLPGFHGRRIAVSPVDGLNLNRVFPGRADGSLTERVAHFLTREVVERSDYLIDMHSGSWNQELWPHVYAPFVGDAALDARTLAFAEATGLRHIVLYGDRPRDPANSVSYPNTAMTRGKPGLTIEIGHLGQSDEPWVRQAHDAALNTMKHLRMLPGSAPSKAGASYYKALREVEAPADGLFLATARIGEVVDVGALLGTVVNYFGETVGELRAPVRGVILMLNYTPPVTKGDTPVTIGEWR